MVTETHISVKNATHLCMKSPTTRYIVQQNHVLNSMFICIGRFMMGEKSKGNYPVTASWCPVCEYLLDEDGNCLECEGQKENDER